MQSLKWLVFVTFIACTSAALEAQGAKKEWWETAVFYQIYPRSFYDTNKDGIGDIRGVIEKLDYLKDLGIDATWLSPIFKSPQKDFGYDISNFTEVDEIFGTMADLEELFRKAKDLGIKVILDFVPNHSSDECDWFKKSIKKITPYTDYYIWVNGTKGIRPNNWNSVFRGSAWTWNDERKEYYFHQFHQGQPDINYRNEAVKKEFDDVLKFWLKKGASGFRVDAINHMFEYEDLRNEPLNDDDKDPDSYGYTHKHYTKDLPETYDVVARWRKLLDDYAKQINTNETFVMMTEAYANLTYTLQYYESDSGEPRAHFPFNFMLLNDLNPEKSAYDFKEVIERWLDNMPSGKTANWVLGNHDQPRVASRYGVDRIDGMLIMLMTLPGVAVTYMGEEIGMIDYRELSWEETQDPQGCNAGKENYKWASRDPQRTPFQWDDTYSAGFTNGTPWLPVHPYFRQTNLKKQKEADYSHYKLYKDLIKLRKSIQFTDGTFKSRAFNDHVFGYVREFKDDKKPQIKEASLILINFSNETYTIDVRDLYELDAGSKILLSGSQSRYKIGDVIKPESVTLRRYDSIVIGGAANLKSFSIFFFLVTFINLFLF